jgi:hypothetical protein
LTSLAFGSLRASLAAYADPHRGGFVSEVGLAFAAARPPCESLAGSVFAAARRGISSIVRARSTN